MSCKIYVGNLAWATDENALGAHFGSVGEVKGAVVMRSEGRSRGFGSVPQNPLQGSTTNGRRLRVNVANQLIRGTGPGVGDYPMISGGSAQGGYHYPSAPYPASAYGGYPHPPPVHGGYMAGGYMNPNSYPGAESGGYTAGAPTNHPMGDGSKGSNQPGAFYPNGGGYPYPPGGGYGY
ncbi:hypothetical protein VP01_1774g3 [Puccinia sorghi]|uniref:RRM domain-containing protein n=1 Tax=Puccinia sorghi TaxID=27349 RepID=A0A0L6VES4_9BASI|nr:hypothetical protein VP01_1774g3 [Puccinia sorghi]